MAFVIVSGRQPPPGVDFDEFCIPNFELESHEPLTMVDLCNRMAELGAFPAPPTFAQVVAVGDRAPSLPKGLFLELFYHARRLGGCSMSDAAIARDDHFVNDFAVRCHLLQTLWIVDLVVPEFGHLDGIDFDGTEEEVDLLRAFARGYAKSAPVLADVVNALRDRTGLKTHAAMYVIRAMYVLRRAPLGLEDALNILSAEDEIWCRHLAVVMATAHLAGGVPVARRDPRLVADDADASRLYAFAALPLLFERAMLPPSALPQVVHRLAEPLMLEPGAYYSDNARRNALRLCKRVLLEVLLVTGDVTVEVEGVPELTAFARRIRDYKRAMLHCVADFVTSRLQGQGQDLVVNLVIAKASAKPGLAFMQHMPVPRPGVPMQLQQLHSRDQLSVMGATIELLL